MINSHNKEIDSLEAKISKYVLTNYPYVLSYEYFNKFKELGDESIERGEIPPQIKRPFTDYYYSTLNGLLITLYLLVLIIFSPYRSVFQPFYSSYSP